MPQQALYLKWRPQTFEDMIGQDHITRTLRNALHLGRIRHAYLFSGPRGTGKTSAARLLAKAVNCTDPDPDMRPCNTCHHCVAVSEGRFLDLIEIDAASNTGVDDVRDLRDKIAFSPSEGQYKVYIIDEVHRFSGAAFDALLKTLEEPPNHAIFVLATTEFHKVPATIKSRCLIFEFRRVSLAEVTERLALIAEHEGVSVDRAALELIAREGTGSVRDSISLLDQILADPDEHITLAMAEQILGTASGQNVVDLAQALIESDAAWGLDIINHSIDSGADPRQFGRQVIEHLRQMVLVQMAGDQLIDVTEERRAILTEQASAIGRHALLAAIRAFNGALSDWQGGWQPQLPLELAFLESIKPVVEEDAPAPVRRAAQPHVRQQEELPPPVRKPESEPPRPQPQAQSQAQKPASADTGAADQVSLVDVRANWSNIQRQAKRYLHTLPALLDHATPRDIRRGVLILSVPVDIFKQKIEAKDARQALQDAITDVMHASIEFKVIVIDDDAEHDAETADILMQDDVLAYGVNELGGEITDIDE